MTLSGGGSLISNAAINFTVGGGSSVIQTVNMSTLGMFTFNGAGKAFNVGGINGSAVAAGTGILALANISTNTAASFNL